MPRSLASPSPPAPASFEMTIAMVAGISPWATASAIARRLLPRHEIRTPSAVVEGEIGVIRSGIGTRLANGRGPHHVETRQADRRQPLFSRHSSSFAPGPAVPQTEGLSGLPADY